MGVSTNGILVFGIQVGEEEEPPEFMEDFEDFDEFLESVSDLPTWGEPGHSFEDQRKFRAAYPIDLVMHCSYDYPMYILAVPGTEMTAHRGHPVDFDKLPDVPEEKIQKFKEWAGVHKIPDAEPRWILCSMWG